MAAERDGQFTVSGQQPSSRWSCRDANIRFSDVIISLLREKKARELAELCRT
jgi:hypothetical protein